MTTSDLIWISALSSVFPLLAGAWCFKNIRRDFAYFLWFFYLVVFVESTGKLTGLFALHNIALYNTYFLLECFFYSFIFHRWVFMSSVKWLLLLFAVLAVTWLVTSL